MGVQVDVNNYHHSPFLSRESEQVLLDRTGILKRRALVDLHRSTSCITQLGRT
jgi:hypothetical protein